MLGTELVLLEQVGLALEVQTWQGWDQEAWGDIAGDLGPLCPPPRSHPPEAPNPHAPGAGRRGGESLWTQAATGCWLQGGQVSSPRLHLITPNSVSSQLGEPLERPGILLLGNVIPSLACEYFISGLKIEAEPSSPSSERVEEGRRLRFRPV